MTTTVSRVAAVLVVGLCVGLAACSKGGNDVTSADAGKLEELGKKIAVLEHKAELLRDAKAIKKLQRAYGYYLDQGAVDQVADLFTDDATAEYVYFGVYAGKEHVKALLYAINGGAPGIKEGMLHEMLQVQPVVDVAPDGMTAKARWREIGMLGQYGKSAEWEGGIYENEYRKVDGVWRISKIHWYETYRVPYEGGWAKKLDLDARKAELAAIAAKLPEPDMPPSEDYKSWPGVYLPPYHYKNPAVTPAETAFAPTDVGDTSLKSLQMRAAFLSAEATRLEDENAIEKLQRSYGFYVDKAMWHQVADLFADNGTLEIGGRGVFVGKKRVLDYLSFLAPEFPLEGHLYNHMQLQPVVDIGPEGQTAKGRWRFVAMVGQWQKSQRWGTGVYENDYVKEDGVWKIKTLHSYFRMYTPYEEGWARKANANTRPEKDLPPDRPPTAVTDNFPAQDFAPYHYENPVTGADVGKANMAPSADEAIAMGQSSEDLEKAVAVLETRIARLEDHHELENLHSIYGYYLDKWQWDDFTSLFAKDGTMEVSLRGVYKGHDSIRRAMDLFGTQGIHQETLHNHIQLQPIIDVAPDGKTAKMRSRALSEIAYYGRAAVWGEGTYENSFVKEDGVWKIQNDHVYTTVFADYDKGWAYGARSAPGPSKEIPPDAPPTATYGVFPKTYLPPYHYNNPVTGKPAVIEKASQ